MTYSAERIAQFEGYVRTVMQAYEVPGMAVALAEQGGVTYQQSFGVRDLQTGLPVDGQTIFGLASITKSFTALAIMQLVERGLLSPQDPVMRYLPEFSLPASQPAEAITIHHLLTHTAGFPSLPALDYSIGGNTEPDAGEETAPAHPPVNNMGELLDFLANGEYRMLGKPGEHFSYSNDCYGLLGEIIERVSGQPYLEYMQQHILQPLGMQRSMFTLEELRQFDNTTELYYRDAKDQLQHSSNWQVAPPFTACGWLKSCADDLIKYALMYANGGEYGGHRLLSAEGIRQMTRGTLEFTRERLYGYGLRVQSNYAGVTLAEHGGSLKGVSSNFGFVPERGVSAVVLCNLTGVPAAKVWLALINLALGLPIEQQHIDYAEQVWPDGLVASIVGAYRSGEGASLEIEHGADGEVSIVVPVGKFRLQCTGADSAVWRYRLTENEVRFLFDETGEVWAIHAGGRVVPRR